MLALLISMFVLFPAASADLPQCFGHCAVLQIGPEAGREIARRPRPYRSTTRLVQKVKRVTGDNLDELQNACEAIAQRVSWWHPASDRIIASLVETLRVDHGDEVRAVISSTELEECRPILTGFEFESDSVINNIDDIEGVRE